jgi:signal transduction histidine kinase
VRASNHIDAEDSRLLSIVLHEVERLDDLVSTMLLVGRPREPQSKEHDLRLIIEEVVAIARRGPAVDANANIVSELPEEPVIAWVDSDQIRQVIWNLVKNALQASPAGTTVRVRAKRDGDLRCVLQVSDQGRGIDPSQRDKVYNMFYSERTHGAGIGLALVRQIVDAHGGSIEIESEQNRGATFLVSLPTRTGAAMLRTRTITPATGVPIN